MAPHIFFLCLLALQWPIIFATTSKFVKSADGTMIYADATGNPYNPSLIFLHGFALSGVVFDRLFTNNKLLSSFYLVRYDMRGHGRSDKPIDPEAHTSQRYAEDFVAVSREFSLTEQTVFVGWSLGASIITDIVANLQPLPIAGAVALSGSPGINTDIIPKTQSSALLALLPQLNQNDNVTLALDARVRFVEYFFKDPSQVPFHLKAEYLGQTVVQLPAVTAQVLIRTQDVSKLFAAGDLGTLKLQVISGTGDALIIGQGVVDTFKPHFKDMVVNFLPGGHAIFDDNQDGLVNALIKFAESVTVVTKRRKYLNHTTKSAAHFDIDEPCI